MEKECEFCSGTGQLSFFKGLSRFLLSVEECPECAGLGVLVGVEDDNKDKKGLKVSTVKQKKGRRK